MVLLQEARGVKSIVWRTGGGLCTVCFLFSNEQIFFFFVEKIHNDDDEQISVN